MSSTAGKVYKQLICFYKWPRCSAGACYELLKNWPTRFWRLFAIWWEFYQTGHKGNGRWTIYWTRFQRLWPQCISTHVKWSSLSTTRYLKNYPLHFPHLTLPPAFFTYNKVSNPTLDFILPYFSDITLNLNRLPP